MENILKIALIAASLFISSAFADNLVLSAKLRIEYPTPVAMSHNGSYLLIKYKDWSFSHENFDPKAFYQNIDLTGYERDFIRSLFDAKKRSKLPEWLAVISRQLSEGLGNKPDTIKQFKLGDAEVLAGHDGNDKGQVYILEDLAIHQILITGTKEQMSTFVRNIKER